MRARLIPILLALSVALGATDAAGGKIKLIPEFNPETKLDRSIKSIEEFRSRLTVGVYEDPRLADPQRLREIIAELDLHTPLGRKVTDLIIHPGTGDFVGFDSGSIEFVGTLPDGSIVISTRDPTGTFTKAKADQLAWVRPNGEPVCFDAVDIGRSEAKMSFTLLIDRSGSMTNVMGQVLATTQHFLSELPANAECSVASFAGDWKLHTAYSGQMCSAARVRGGIAAKGSTDVFTPLSHFYQRYAAPAYDGWQKAVIIITDGAVTQNEDQAPRVKAAKGDVKTFVFWLGNRKEEHLADIADYSLSRQGDVRSFLGNYLGELGDAYGSQQVLKPRACTPQQSKATP